MRSTSDAFTKCDDLESAIEQYKARGYRLDMIFPADNPREALVSKGGEAVRLQAESTASAGGGSDRIEAASTPPVAAGSSASDPNWITGRAGMEYRDLVPDRMGGKMIASHIRLTEGGDVPDYVHYHKVEFQMIRCIKGRIKVVYEDQGEPFWLEAGDWVIQPPEIRHRVLECEAGSEVIEISMPAEHETWVEHGLELPTGVLDPEREFRGQRFVRFVNPKDN